MEQTIVTQEKQARLGLTLRYDREGDILYIDQRPPYAEQETEELEDDIVARLNPHTGEVETLEVLFFSTRLLRSTELELPISGHLSLMAPALTLPFPKVARPLSED